MHVKKNSFSDLPALGIIVLLGILIYSNSFNSSFHLDDTVSIVDNMNIRNLSDAKNVWNYSQTRFIPYYSFAVNYHINGLNVWGYHLFNLTIHLINACLVYGLTLLIFSSPVLKDQAISKDKKLLAFITALLFVSHPLATQSVTYIVQRINSLAALFYLLSLAIYLKARLPHKSIFLKYSLFAGSLACAILAMLSKENAFTLPFAIVLIEIYFLHTRKLSISFKDYRVILIVAGFLIFISLVLFHFSSYIFRTIPPSSANDFRTVTVLNYLLTQFSVILKYIQLLFLPINQNLDHDFTISNSFFDPRTISSFLLLLSLIILAIFLFKRNRIISFGIFWFFLTLSIESSIKPISDLIFEHRTYLPSFGLFLVLSSGIYFLLWNNIKSIAIAVFAVLIGANSYMTFERNKVWKDELTLWSDVITKSPNKARGYANRGNVFFEKNQNTQALADFNRAIELSPLYAQAYFNRANVFGSENKIDKAHEDYDKAIKLYKDYSDAYMNRGSLFKREKKFDRALEDYNKAIEIEPDYAEAYNNRGSVYVATRKYKEGIEDLNKAIVLNPDFAMAYANRGVAELNLDDKENGCQDFKKAAELGLKAVEEMYNKNCR